MVLEPHSIADTHFGVVRNQLHHPREPRDIDGRRDEFAGNVRQGSAPGSGPKYASQHAESLGNTRHFGV
jgi:hypothetical protein